MWGKLSISKAPRHYLTDDDSSLWSQAVSDEPTEFDQIRSSSLVRVAREHDYCSNVTGNSG
jgi:hypothetical protein